jgi:hypothetical protein
METITFLIRGKMRRFISLIIVLIVLSACGGMNQTALLSPTDSPPPTQTPSIVPTILSSEAPVSTPFSTPVPSSLILAEFPLEIGITWEYEAEIAYQDPNDSMELLTWTGTVTDRVLDKKVDPDGKIVFTVQEDLEPEPPQSVWRQSRTFEYSISGDGIFDGGMKVFQYPLEDNQSWPVFAGFEYEMTTQYIGKVVTPYGELDNCYNFFIVTRPDTSIKTFCSGIGFAKHSYSHHGTPQNETFVLSSFTPGER